MSPVHSISPWRDNTTCNPCLKNPGGNIFQERVMKAFLREVRVDEILVTLTHALNTKVNEFTKMDFTQNLRPVRHRERPYMIFTSDSSLPVLMLFNDAKHSVNNKYSVPSEESSLWPRGWKAIVKETIKHSLDVGVSYMTVVRCSKSKDNKMSCKCQVEFISWIMFFMNCGPKLFQGHTIENRVNTILSQLGRNSQISKPRTRPNILVLSEFRT